MLLGCVGVCVGGVLFFIFLSFFFSFFFGGDSRGLELVLIFKKLVYV